jgi:uracil-DNA glycosylase
MAAPLARLLELLEQGPDQPERVFNPWRDTDERDGTPRRAMPGRRLDNLAAYIEARQHKARYVLMGEAPSHRGCRFSGIPFCSEHELVHKADLVARRPLTLTSRDAATKPFTERSAAVIWGELQHTGSAFEVVLWNTYPWHPYGDDVTSNRKPRPAEVRAGHAAFAAFSACFTQPLRVLAVGKVAELALGQWPDARCEGYIRHPAHGGEALFRSGFREALRT